MMMMMIDEDDEEHILIYSIPSNHQIIKNSIVNVFVSLLFLRLL